MQPDRDLPELVSTGITEQVWSHLSSIYHGDIIIHTRRYDKTVVHYSTTWANSKAGSGVTHLNQSTGHLLMLKSRSDCHFQIKHRQYAFIAFYWTWTCFWGEKNVSLWDTHIFSFTLCDSRGCVNVKTTGTRIYGKRKQHLHAAAAGLYLAD